MLKLNIPNPVLFRFKKYKRKKVVVLELYVETKFIKPSTVQIQEVQEEKGSCIRTLC